MMTLMEPDIIHLLRYNSFTPIMSKINSIAIVINPIENAGITPVTNLVQILSKRYQITLITGKSKDDPINNNLKVHKLLKIDNYNVLRTRNYIISIILYQMFLLKTLFDIRKNINEIVFFIGCDEMAIPIVLAKILKIRVSMIYPGSSILSNSNNYFFIRLMLTISNLVSNLFSDRIVLYSPRLIKQYHISNLYINKISYMSEHIIDVSRFKRNIELSNRKFDFGYMGRLCQEKGIVVFLDVMFLLLGDRPSLNIMIIGDGTLKKDLITRISNSQYNNIQVVDWIDHSEIPNYLNNIKILLIPSYTEGLPNVLLEAMACGCITVSNGVGAIPDIIKDGVNGFILNGTTPREKSITLKNILDIPGIEEVSKRGEDYIKNNYSKENVERKWEGF